MTELEKQIQKSVKLREKISKIITDNYHVEKDFADLVALDTINQAIGNDKIKEYNKAKRVQAFWDKAGDWISWAVVGLVGATLAFCVLYGIYWVGSGFHNWVTAPEAPRKHTALAESSRFKENSFIEKDLKEDGLQDENNMCLAMYSHGFGIEQYSNKEHCIHKNKVESLNILFDIVMVASGSSQCFKKA